MKTNFLETARTENTSAKDDNIPAELTAIPGMMLGTIVSLSAQGSFVQLSGVASAPVLALSICVVSPQNVGKVCVIQFIEGDSTRPIIMGMLRTPAEITEEDIPPVAMINRAPLSVSQDGESVVIEASEELVLRCGESQIIMAATGVVQIRALYIDSRAEATHRLKGGSVQVN